MRVSPAEDEQTRSAPRARADCAIQSAPTGLRGFIEVLEQAGRLTRVQELTHWKYDLGQMTRDRKSPLLFENVVDYPGQRVFTNGLRDCGLIALALGLPPDFSRVELIAEAKRRMAGPVPPRTVAGSPPGVKILTEGEVDLLALPVPHWNMEDIGRYLGTWHINVTKDADTGIRNVGVYRMQLLGHNQATVSTSPSSDLARHVKRAESRGRALPMAVAIGVSEAVVMAAAAGCAYGTDEFELAGALQQQPVDLIHCATADLEVPADSEIVIEGFLHAHARIPDGPYFDYTGAASVNPHAYLFEATRLMLRDEFLFRGTSIGVPGAEDHQIFAILAEIGLLDFHGSDIKKSLQKQILRQRLRRWTEQ